MRHAIFMVVFLQVPGALTAQELRIGCLPPLRPDAALPIDLLRQYRRELSIDFEVYFRDTTAYIACLDAERAAVFEEARAVTQAYAEFLELVTKDENE